MKRCAYFRVLHVCLIYVTTNYICILHLHCNLSVHFSPKLKLESDGTLDKFAYKYIFTIIHHKEKKTIFCKLLDITFKLLLNSNCRIVTLQIIAVGNYAYASVFLIVVDLRLSSVQNFL